MKIMDLNSQGGISEYNRAAGIDAGFFLGQNLTIIGLLAKTQSPDEVLAKVPDGTDLAATVLAVFFVPIFFVVVRRLFPGGHVAPHGTSIGSAATDAAAAAVLGHGKEQA